MTLSIFCRKWRNWYQFGIFSKQIDYFNACKIRAHLTKKKLKRFASVGPSALPYSALDGIFNGLIIDCNFPEMTTFLPLFFVFLCRSIAADIASSSLRRELREKEFGFLSRIGLLEQCSSSCCCSAVNCFSSASSRGQQTTTTNFFFAKVSKEEAKN